MSGITFVLIGVVVFFCFTVIVYLQLFLKLLTSRNGVVCVWMRRVLCLHRDPHPSQPNVCINKCVGVRGESFYCGSRVCGMRCREEGGRGRKREKIHSYPSLSLSLSLSLQLAGLDKGAHHLATKQTTVMYVSAQKNTT